MILATVGTQLAFPRLIGALDALAERHGLEIFAQTADPLCDARRLMHAPHLSPAEFAERAAAATLLVGHAGIGTVLTARKLQKPLVIYPRRFSLGEHRNDHQMATARTLEATTGVHVAWDNAQLEAFLLAEQLTPASLVASENRAALIAHLKAFVSI